MSCVHPSHPPPLLYRAISSNSQSQLQHHRRQLRPTRLPPQSIPEMLVPYGLPGAGNRAGQWIGQNRIAALFE